MTPVERSRVAWGQTTIEYQIRRSARRATVSLIVEPAEGLVVSAPVTTPVAKLDAVVRAKVQWVVLRLGERGELARSGTGREFVSGESYRYLGRQYRLRILRGSGAGEVALHGGWLELSLPRGMAPELRAERARAALQSWYGRLAKERLPAWARRWAERMGADLREVRVVDQARRWGSCGSGGVLRFNWRIIQAPRRLVDYVLAHEVVHLVHEHHGRAFWAALGRLLPDYEARRRELRELGTELDW